MRAPSLRSERGYRNLGPDNVFRTLSPIRDRDWPRRLDKNTPTAPSKVTTESLVLPLPKNSAGTFGSAICYFRSGIFEEGEVEIPVIIIVSDQYNDMISLSAGFRAHEMIPRIPGEWCSFARGDDPPLSNGLINSLFFALDSLEAEDPLSQ